VKNIGILTAGGDSPGLNSAIRGIGKAALKMDMQVLGFRDGFRGLVENRFIRLDKTVLPGLLTVGGTVLGTSRDKPHRMVIGGKTLDMTDAAVETYRKHNLDALICMGGGGTQKNAFRLLQKGLNILTLPKTIDNDVALTDVTFGFDTSLGIATEAIDRLHSTAHSHHRIIVVEIMGHNAGWLALGAGIAGGADVILIPEIPYDVEKIAPAIRRRVSSGRPFSIVAVAEGARNLAENKQFAKANEAKKKARTKAEKKAAALHLDDVENQHKGSTLRLAQKLEELTSLETRLTILGHLQRGGTPSAADRLLTTQLGTACARLIQEGQFGVMVAIRGGQTLPIPLEEVVGKRKIVPLDHPWIESARLVNTSLGD